MNLPSKDVTDAVVDDWDETCVRVDPLRQLAPVVLVWDHADDAAITHALLDAGLGSGGVITVDPTPGSSSAQGLAHDVLAALGCSVRRLSEQKISGVIPAWQAAAAWVATLGISRVIVLRAHRISQAAMTSLLSLRHDGIELVLVYHGGARVQLGWQLPGGEDYPVIEDLAQLPDAARPPVPSIAGKPEQHNPVMAPVPDADVLAFRAEAFRTLSPEQFATLDAVYRAGMDAACRWMHDLPDPDASTGFVATVEQMRELFPIGLSADEVAAGSALLHGRYESYQLQNLVAGLLCVGRSRDDANLPARFHDAAAVQRFLAELVIASPTRAHTITLVRGAQAGCLRHGMLIELPRINLFTASGPGMTALPVTEALAETIRCGLASPVHAAALVTAVFTGFPAQYLLRIPISALSADAAVLTLRTQPRGGAIATMNRHFVVGVPEPARSALRAARRFLQLRGTQPDRPLLAGGVGVGGHILTASALECGVGLGQPASVETNWHVKAQGWWVGPNLHRDSDWTATTDAAGRWLVQS
ncbi:hypothetical protein ACFVH4_09100 [Nocardia ignorata]|uniref:hypothetical protein n=1 Tax=Nocardia ignorata TaxID=145285 RepID=UPI00362737EB